MGAGIPAPQGRAPGGQPTEPGPGPGPRPGPQAAPGPTLNSGPILAQTVRHFFPDLGAWMDEVEDPRFQPRVVYPKRFLLWWGLLFVCKLGSRRQLDYQLNS